MARRAMGAAHSGTLEELREAEARHEAAVASWLEAAARARGEGTASAARAAGRALTLAVWAGEDEAAAWWAWRDRGKVAERTMGEDGR